MSRIFATIGLLILLIFILLPADDELIPETTTSPSIDAAIADLSNVSQSDLSHGVRLATLGKKLFFDRSLSPTGNRSCADCHLGLAKEEGPWSIPRLESIGGGPYYWNGRHDDLVSAAAAAFDDPLQSDISRTKLISAIFDKHSGSYSEIFGAIPAPIRQLPPARPTAPPILLPVQLEAYALRTIGKFEILQQILYTAEAQLTAPVTELRNHIHRRPPRPADNERWTGLNSEIRDQVDTVYRNSGKALAAYIRAVRANESAFDKFARSYLSSRGNLRSSFHQGFDEQAFAGLKIFSGRGHCIRCHHGPRFSDDAMVNIGLGQRGETLRLGGAVGLVTRGTEDQDTLQTALGAFKTPSLRNVADSAPYMHDGRYQTLGEVIDYYSELPDKSALGQRSAQLQPRYFTPLEKQQLLAFLVSLSSRRVDPISHDKLKKWARP